MIALTLNTPSNFDFHATVMSHGWYQLAPNTYHQDTHILERPYLLTNDKPVKLMIQSGRSHLLIITVIGQAIISSVDRYSILRAIEAMFNLNQGLTPFYQRMSATEGYEWVTERKCARLLASPTIWEDLAKTLLTTNTSWGNTVKMTAQLSAIDPHHIFPSPQMIVSLSEDEFAEAVGAGYRAAYLYQAAQRIVSGDVNLATWHSLDSDALYRAITDLKGFGDYSAGTLMRLMGHFDRLAIDTVARKAYEQVTGTPPEKDADIRDYYEKFGNWRGLVLWMDCIRDE
ncbi:MAG: hypothetical protein WBC91_03870 [Phototrophicaceae bacterium]